MEQILQLFLIESELLLQSRGFVTWNKTLMEQSGEHATPGALLHQKHWREGVHAEIVGGVDAGKPHIHADKERQVRYQDYIKIRLQAPVTTPNLHTKTADLRERIMKPWGTQEPPTFQGYKRKYHQSLYWKMRTVPTNTMTETHQLIQAAATVIQSKSRSKTDPEDPKSSTQCEHVSPVLTSLHWIPVPFGICSKILLLTFKVLNSVSFLSVRPPTHPHTWKICAVNQSCCNKPQHAAHCQLQKD